MTEGIIQKVIKKHIKKPRPKWYGRTDVATDMKELQQELIAEIKTKCFTDSKYSPFVFLHDLIGDNQE